MCSEEFGRWHPSIGGDLAECVIYNDANKTVSSENENSRLVLFYTFVSGCLWGGNVQIECCSLVAYVFHYYYSFISVELIVSTILTILLVKSYFITNPGMGAEAVNSTTSRQALFVFHLAWENPKHGRTVVLLYCSGLGFFTCCHPFSTSTHQFSFYTHFFNIILHTHFLYIRPISSTTGDFFFHKRGRFVFPRWHFRTLSHTTFFLCCSPSYCVLCPFHAI